MGAVNTLPLVVVIAVELVVTTCLAVSRLSQPGQYLYELIFHRGFVQYLTLFTFALMLTLLGSRLIRCLRTTREICRLRKKSDEDNIPDVPLGEVINEVKDTLACHGRDAALAEVQRFADQQKANTQRIYGTVYFLMCLLPVLGFFGTMFSLSGAVSAGFSRGNMSMESIGILVGSLGTALDTLALAMVCGMIGGVISWVLSRMETPVPEQQAALIRRLSGLEHPHRPAGAGRSSARHAQEVSAVTVSRAELQASATMREPVIEESSLPISPEASYLFLLPFLGVRVAIAWARR